MKMPTPLYRAVKTLAKLFARRLATPCRRWCGGAGIPALVALVCLLWGGGTVHAEEAQWVTYKGGDGPGKGKRIVFVTGDEEYRSEESMPAMARILAERHGFHCTVLFSVNAKSGEIDPSVADNIPGLDDLKNADLMVVFMRKRKREGRTEPGPHRRQWRRGQEDSVKHAGRRGEGESGG